MAAVELVLRARLYRRTLATRSIASRPMRRSSGITPTAWALAISISPGPATAIFTDRATTSFARPPVSAPSTTALSAVRTAAAFFKIIAYLPFSHGVPFPYSTWNVRWACSSRYLHLYGGTTIFDGSIWAARTMRKATISSSPMRGLRSDSFAATSKTRLAMHAGGERMRGACAASVDVGAPNGSEHSARALFPRRFPPRADCDGGPRRRSRISRTHCDKLRRPRTQNSNSGQSEWRRRGSFKQ